MNQASTYHVANGNQCVFRKLMLRKGKNIAECPLAEMVFSKLNIKSIIKN